MNTCPHCHSQVPDGYVACPNCKRYLDAPIYGQGRPLENPRQALDSLRTELQGLKKSQEAGLERLRRLERALEALTGFIDQQEPSAPPVSEQPVQQVQAAEPEPQRPQLEEEEFSFQEHREQEPEFRISSAKEAPTPTVQMAPPDAAAAPQEPQRPLTPPRPRKSPKDKTSLESALGQKGLLAIGIVVMIFGVGYFLKYTFDQGIIGPVGQVGLAYAWGMLLLAGGELARRKGYRQYGLWVLAGGVASLYFATFAAYRIFEIMGMVPAFLLLVGATLLAIAMALRYDVLGLAFLGILGGFLTPLMLSTGQDNMFFLYGYLTVLNAGVLATAFFKRWTGLSWLGLVGTMLLFAGWMWDGYHMTDFWPTFIFLSITFLGYTLAPVLGAVFRREEDAKSLAGARKAVYIGIPASFYTFGYTYEIVTERFGQKACAIPCLAYAAIFGACAWFLFKHFRNTPGKGGSLVLAANAVLFAVLAVPITLDAHWITIVWALQGGVLAYLGYKLGGRGLFLLGQCLLYLALCRYFLQDLPDTFGWISNPKFKDMTGAQFTFYGGYTRIVGGASAHRGGSCSRAVPGGLGLPPAPGFHQWKGSGLVHGIRLCPPDVHHRIVPDPQHRVHGLFRRLRARRACGRPVRTLGAVRHRPDALRLQEALPGLPAPVAGAVRHHTAQGGDGGHGEVLHTVQDTVLPGLGVAAGGSQLPVPQVQGTARRPPGRRMI